MSRIPLRRCTLKLTLIGLGDVDLVVEVRPYVISNAILQDGIKAVEAAGIATVITDAITTIKSALDLDVVGIASGGITEESGARALSWFRRQDKGRLIDALKDLAADHLLPVAAAAPALMQVVCAAGAAALDNETNFNAISALLAPKDVKIACECRHGLYIKSDGLREVLADTLDATSGVAAFMAWLAVERPHDAMGKLMPLAHLTGLAGKVKAGTPKK